MSHSKDNKRYKWCLSPALLAGNRSNVPLVSHGNSKPPQIAAYSSNHCILILVCTSGKKVCLRIINFACQGNLLLKPQYVFQEVFLVKWIALNSTLFKLFLEIPIFPLSAHCSHLFLFGHKSQYNVEFT